MKTAASKPTWIKEKYEAIKRNSPNTSRRPQEDNRQQKGVKLKLEEFDRGIVERDKTLRNRDCLLRAQKHIKGR